MIACWIKHVSTLNKCAHFIFDFFFLVKDFYAAIQNSHKSLWMETSYMIGFLHL